MIFFVTGNKNKFQELATAIPNLAMLDINLTEIQSTDPHEILRHKLQDALKQSDKELIVEDTSLHFDCLGGLPGPLIKWFLKEMGNDGLAELAHKMGDNNCTARTIIGYAKSAEEIHFFEAEQRGQIVPERGRLDFGWGPIFQPDGHSKTFGEMTRAEKIPLSMRGQAAQKLADFLISQH